MELRKAHKSEIAFGFAFVMIVIIEPQYEINMPDIATSVDSCSTLSFQINILSSDMH